MGATLLAALIKHQLSAYKVENFSVTHILTDGDSGLRKVANEIDVRLDATGAGKHVLTVETKITMDIGSAYRNTDMAAEVFMRLNQDQTRMLAELEPRYRAFIRNNGALRVLESAPECSIVESAPRQHAAINRMQGKCS